MGMIQMDIENDNKKDLMPAGASGVVVASFHQPVVSGFATNYQSSSSRKRRGLRKVYPQAC